jgi:hypothetical protein
MAIMDNPSYCYSNPSPVEKAAGKKKNSYSSGKEGEVGFQV